MHALLELKSDVQRRVRIAQRPCAQPATGPWERRFADLKAFKRAHGHCNVPTNYPKDRSLAIWVANCRRQRKLGTLAQDRIERLDTIGFCWAVRNRRCVARNWDAMVAQLKAFHRGHGHSNVPYGEPSHRDLATWLNGVRCNKRAGRLDANRVRQLNALGVVWEPQKTRWDRMFAALMEYRKRHGDCNVPFGWSENPALAKWVKGMRIVQRRGELSAERAERLDAIGFAWDRGGEQRWEETYASLVDYQRAYGHCRISTLSEEYAALGNWVHTQRTLHKKGQLDKGQIARLNAIGFTWDFRREQWDAMFAALAEFRRAAGHCDVPLRWADNRQLGSWVMTQRAAYKAGRLDGEQIERLRAVGFRFSIAGDRLTVGGREHSRPTSQPKTRRAA
jgi:hypothetical protein